MWSNLPFDLLANIFSYLPLDSLVRAMSTCKQWKTCCHTHPSTMVHHHYHPPWFIATPISSHSVCYAHNPILNHWHELPMSFMGEPVIPLGPIGSLLLLRSTKSTTLQLSICNPFTKQSRHLPMLNIDRTTPAVGVAITESAKTPHCPSFRVYVAGGMAKAGLHNNATYEQTLEMYDSGSDTWCIIGSLSLEFAVRLTVWTPNESVYLNGILYWMTSARAYSLMGFDIGSGICREVHVLMADRLEFATLVLRNGKLVLVGGMSGGDACVWELMSKGDNWKLVDKIPGELRMKFLGRKGKNWVGTKCVGNDEVVCLYRELGFGMVVGRSVGDKSKWDWVWVEGYNSLIRSKKGANIPIKGVLLHPTLAPFLHLK